MKLRSSFCILLFEDIKLKKDFYLRLLPRATDLVVFECGRSIPISTANVPNALIIKCASHGDLLKNLHDILEDRSLLLNDHFMNTLVIENLSSFYWTLRCKKVADRIHWYEQLHRVLLTIRDEYKCNILVTAWDNNYERGFNVRERWSGQPQKLDDLTYMPLTLYQRVEHVFAFQKGRSFMFKENRWVLLLNGEESHGI